MRGKLLAHAAVAPALVLLDLLAQPGDERVGFRRRGDARALEHAWWAGDPHAAEPQACGAGATRALLAAAHRLRHVAVHIQPQACPVGGKRLVGVGARKGRVAGIDDAAVARYWAQLQP